MRWADSHGCITFLAEGHSLVAVFGDPLWGLNQFERDLPAGGQLVRLAGIHERVRDAILQSLVVGGPCIKAAFDSVARRSGE